MQALTQPTVKAAAVDVAPPVTGAHGQSRRSTRGVVNYVERPKVDEPLYLNVYTQEENPSNLVLEESEVEVHDVRPLKDQLSLEKNGFNLYKLEVPDLDWQNKEEVERVYYPLVEKLLKEATNATRVHIFDHTLRLGKLKNNTSKKVEISKEVAKQGQPVGMAHVDYSASSGIDRLDALLPNEAPKLRETPFAVVQMWRPIKGPVKASPLGMIDASTVAKEDLSEYTINFPGRTGYNLAVHHNKNHKWYFADQMQTDEAYLFVCFDSRFDRARFTPHTGFRDLSVSDDAPPRESVELRSYVFWENEPKQELKREL